MNFLEGYTVIKENSMDFDEAKEKLKKRVINKCKQGFMLLGNASVKATEYTPDVICYDLSQTFVKGEQEISDYDIIYIKNGANTLPKTIRGTVILLEKKMSEGWEVIGGGVLDEKFKVGMKKFSEPSYKIYHTIIKQ